MDTRRLQLAESSGNGADKPREGLYEFPAENCTCGSTAENGQQTRFVVFDVAGSRLRRQRMVVLLVITGVVGTLGCPRLRAGVS